MGLFGDKVSTSTTNGYDPAMAGLNNEVIPLIRDLLQNIPVMEGGNVADMNDYQIEGLNAFADYGAEGGTGFDIMQQIMGAGSDLMGSMGESNDMLTQFLNNGDYNVVNNGPDMNMVNGMINNDVLGGQIDAAMRDSTRMHTEQVLPGARMASAVSGNATSSRGAMGEAIAERGYQDRYADTAATMRGNAYSQALGVASNVSGQNAALESAGNSQFLSSIQSLMQQGGMGAELLGSAGEMGLENIENTVRAGDAFRNQDQAVIDDDLKTWMFNEIDTPWMFANNGGNMLGQMGYQFGEHENKEQNGTGWGQLIGGVIGAYFGGAGGAKAGSSLGAKVDGD